MRINIGYLKLAGAVAFAWLALAGHAQAACNYSLQSFANGDTADATKVMGNFNYILNCPNFTGSVGIGTTTPNAALSISTSAVGSPALLQMNNSNASVSPDWRIKIGGYADYEGYFRIGRGNFTGFDLGITWDGHTQAGSNKTFGVLNEGGFVSVNNANTGFYTHSGSFAELTGMNSVRFSVSLAEKMRIDGSGNVGIGTTSPSYLLHVNGTVYATGAAGALSDVRHKTKIAVIGDGALDSIMRLRPVTFYWKQPKDSGMQGQQMGLIAQEVEKILPNTVLTANDKENTKGLKYNELTVLLIKSVQEQQREIADLHAALAAVRRDNAKLAKQIQQIRYSRTAQVQ